MHGESRATAECDLGVLQRVTRHALPLALLLLALLLLLFCRLRMRLWRRLAFGGASCWLHACGFGFRFRGDWFKHMLFVLVVCVVFIFPDEYVLLRISGFLRSFVFSLVLSLSVYRCSSLVDTFLLFLGGKFRFKK